MLKYNMHRLYTLKKNGSLIYCEQCRYILGYINPASYNCINIHILCACDSYGSLEMSRERNAPIKKVNRVPDLVNRIYVCSVCKRPLFSVMPDRVKNYSYYIKCKCGAEFDTKSNFSKRLGETVDLLKIQD